MLASHLSHTALAAQASEPRKFQVANPSGGGRVRPFSVNNENDHISSAVDVTDDTDYDQFYGLLQTSMITAIDAGLWAATSALVFFVFLCALLVWPVVEGVFRVSGRILGGRLFGYSFTIPGDKQQMPLKLSLVSLPVPGFHAHYLHKLIHEGEMADVLHEIRQPPNTFSLKLADFFIHLSALVYESNQVLQAVFEKWGNDFQYTRFGHDGCCILAVWSVKYNFVCLTFKGTSPLDLSEWLTDCSLRKTPAKNAVLPGLVHTGFYSALGFPDEEVVTSFLPDVLDDYRKSRQSNLPLKPIPFNLQRYDRKDFFFTGILPNLLAILLRFPVGTKPDLWIAGHSLGAATASLFTAMMLWQRTQIGKASPVVNLKWDEEFILRGTYTFGTPKTGDTDFRDAMETVLSNVDDTFTTLNPEQPQYQFYRVINANDPVCSAPGGPLSSLGSYLRGKKEAPAPMQPKVNSQTGLPATRPPGITLLDFRHIGQPVRVGWRSGRLHMSERPLRSVLKTLVKEIVLSPLAALTSPTWLAAAVGSPVSPLFLIKDHFPTEYALNLSVAEAEGRAARDKVPASTGRGVAI